MSNTIRLESGSKPGIPDSAGATVRAADGLDFAAISKKGNLK